MGMSVDSGAGGVKSEPNVVPMIERHFGDLAASGQEPSAPPGGPAQPHGLDALMFSDPGLPAKVSLNVVLPYDARPDSLAKQSDHVREMLAGLMLQRRLDSLALQPGAPFSSAGVRPFASSSINCRSLSGEV